jgi:tetratricopeptide (TPR) repeat protein|tara:strand:- start:3368 stop:4876 length:1509 start_codon:yes stop_codon:yes gene_type:complete
MRVWIKALTVLPIGCIFPVALIFANNPANEGDPLREADQALKQHLSADNYHAALPLAERVVALLKGKQPYQPTRVITPLRNLAVIQHKVGRAFDAQRNLDESIRITVAAEGEYAPSLVDPLRYLAKLHFENREYAESLAALRRAQHITHRDDGVYTLNQLNIVDWITNNHMKTSDYSAADVQQRFYYRINETNFGADDPRMIPVMTKLGAWFRYTGQLPDALKMYRDSMHLLEQQGTQSDLTLIEPLQAISSVLYLLGDCCPEEPLDRAMNILASDSGTDAEDRVAALIRLADMTLLKKNEVKAKALYKQAWHMLASHRDDHKSKELFGTPTQLGISGTDDAVLAFRGATRAFGLLMPDVVYFARPAEESAAEDHDSQVSRERGLIGSPLPLCFPQLLDLVNVKGDEQLADYFVDLDFSVDHKGRALQVAVVDSNAPPRLGRYVRNMLQRTRFRPQMSEGEPVKSERLAIHQTFTSTDHRNDSFADSRAAVLQGCQILASAH